LLFLEANRDKLNFILTQWLYAWQHNKAAVIVLAIAPVTLFKAASAVGVNTGLFTWTTPLVVAGVRVLLWHTARALVLAHTVLLVARATHALQSVFASLK
jgi:hypothetical protein